MAIRYLLIFGAFIAGSAVLLQLDAFRDVRKSTVSFIHKTLGDVLQTCPYHAAMNLLQTLGLSNSDISQTKQNADGYSSAGIQVIKYYTNKLFTKEELSSYVGESDSPGLYIGILGRVYDVEGGKQHYGPDCGYHFFSGCDGTKAFMTGKFNEEGLIDTVLGLSPGQMLELENWLKFYDDTYIYKGKVIGNFYDESGQPTSALYEALHLIEDGHIDKQKKEGHRKQFPPCNSANTKDGGWISCSNRSGGIKRDWVGVPRKYHVPAQSTPSCVCVRTEGPPYDQPDSDLNEGELNNPHLEEYKGCDPTSEACQIF